MQLDKQVALVTGGTKGIGAATAIRLAERGAQVAIVGRHADAEAEQTRDRIKALDRQCLLLTADVGQPEAARRCVRETAAELGAPTVLVHSAGGPVNGGFLELTAKLRRPRRPTWRDDAMTCPKNSRRAMSCT